MIHTWAWSLRDDARLSKQAFELLASAAEIFISAVTLYEITQKVRLGKWHDMDGFAAQLEELALRQGVQIAVVTGPVAAQAGLLDWTHRDPFDRMIAATALVPDLALISADTTFDSLPGLRRVW